MIGVPYVELRNIKLDQDTFALIPQEVSMRVLVVPLGEKDGMLNVAMADVNNVQSIDYIPFLVFLAAVFL